MRQVNLTRCFTEIDVANQTFYLIHSQCTDTGPASHRSFAFIPCSEIRKRTKINGIIDYTLKQKWRWAGHIARMKDKRWTRRCTE